MTLWYVLTFLISALVICSFLYLRLKHQLLKEIDQFLIDETQEMERVLSHESKETYSLMRFEDDVMTRNIILFFQFWMRGNRSMFRKFRETGMLKDGVDQHNRKEPGNSF
jgi:hypothetical protein